jgi:hypothetical protein
VAVVGEISKHGTSKGGVAREEAGVVDSTYEFLFVCELMNVGEGGVFGVGREIRHVKGDAGKWGSVFGGV